MKLLFAVIILSSQSIFLIPYFHAVKTLGISYYPLAIYLTMWTIMITGYFIGNIIYKRS